MYIKKIYCLLILLFLSITYAYAAPISEQIIIDQFGWRKSSKKVAIFANPIKGQNSGVTYIPGTTYYIKRVKNNATVYSNTITYWGDDQDGQTGDQVWQGDFSDFNIPGEYYIYDPANNLQSYNF